MKLVHLTLLFLVGAVVTAQSIDVIHQVIDLTPRWENESLEGSSTLHIKFLSPTQTLQLDGSKLSVRKVEAGNELTFKYRPDLSAGNLSIDLDKNYRPGEEIELTIFYQTEWVNETDPNNIWGSLGKGVRFFESSTTEPNRQKQIWSVGEPDGNRFWFPGHFSNADFRTTDLLMTVEKPLMVLSNGSLVSTTDNGDNTRTYHWKTTDAHPPHLTAFIVGRYLPVTQEFENVKIVSYCYPHEADATAATVERLPDMMKYYGEVTGLPYPYSSYSQVFVQEFARWQGNVMSATITENMVDDWVTHKDFRWLWDMVESEALASQWYGVSIVPESWEDTWLSRGFARHLSGLYNEYKNGRDEYLSYQLNPQLTTYLSDWSSGKIQPIMHSTYEDVTTFVRSNHPYLHAASVLNMLRAELGDKLWFEALATFSTTYANGSVSTADFIKTVEKVTGRDLGWFFDQWIYGVGHPIFEVKKEWDEARREVKLNVKQIQRLDTLPTSFAASKYFGGKMRIELDGTVAEIVMEPERESSYVFPLPAKPRFVNFDFESSWVKEERFEKSTEEWTNQLLFSKDILARISALNQLGSIASQEACTESEKKAIYSVMRSSILSPDSYWRLKMLALWQLQGLLVQNGELELDEATEKMLLQVIEKEESWVKSSAVWFLGMTQHPEYADLYIDLFDDWSDRVTNAAAIALGKTKSPKAFEALIELKSKPSWKNQSLISALNGLQWLEDERGIELALSAIQNNEAAHWTLSTPIWDHRLAAGNTLKALNASDKGYDFIYGQLQSAIDENDLNDVLYNVLQLVNLGDVRGTEAFEYLKEMYADDPNVLIAIKNYEKQFLSALGR